MVSILTKNFATLVSDWAASAQASVARAGSAIVLEFTQGTIFLALAEAQASLGLWLQGEILRLLTATRLSTSKGIDVDTWTADYMPGATGGQVLSSGATSPRLPASPASGLVTFARATPTNPAVVPVGAQLQSADGAMIFAVVADTTNAAYGATVANGAPGYTIPAAVASLDLPVKFQFPSNYVAGTYTGPVGNVQLGAITVLKTGISGVDTVSNAAAFTNGFLAESDAALKARFPLYIASLAKGTEGAIRYAVASVRQGISCQIWEPGIGGFTTLTVYVDDGTGNIPGNLLTAAQAAIYDPVIGVKAAGVLVNVLAATRTLANVTMVLTTAQGYDHNTVVAQVAAALQLYINSLKLGSVTNGLIDVASTLSYGKLYQIAFDASPGVIDVTGYTLNATTNDLVPAAGRVIKAGSIVVS